MKFNNVLETIGKTPVVRLSKLFPNHNVWIKLERTNPGGSVKDRIALAMIEAAEKEGKINKDTKIIEPTSGNTGVGLAMVSAVKGYDLTLVMPESMSVERRKLMSAYGAKIVLTPRELGMKGAIAKAQELAEKESNSWVPQQFENAANPEIHRNTTAQEILNDFSEGVDFLISGVGTGGHITGISEILKQKFPQLKAFAVEPEQSPVISGGAPGPHAIQGIGAGFIPKNLDLSIIDRVETVDSDTALATARRLMAEEGILAGISSGAAVAAADRLAKLPEFADKLIVVILPSASERYLSTALFEGIEG